MKYYTYILECADKTFYVGCTNDLEKRLKQHNQSKAGAHYTKIRRPVILKYVEEFETIGAARKRENEIKSWRRDEKEKLIGKRYQVGEHKDRGGGPGLKRRAKTPAS